MHTADAIIGVAAAIAALALPLNTALLLVLNRRQKEGNHHLRTIARRDRTIAEMRGLDPDEEVGPRPRPNGEEHHDR